MQPSQRLPLAEFTAKRKLVVSILQINSSSFTLRTQAPLTGTATTQENTARRLQRETRGHEDVKGAGGITVREGTGKLQRLPTRQIHSLCISEMKLLLK